jgi:hypothetical protein
VRYPSGSISKLSAYIACDDAGACIERLRKLTDEAETFGMEPFVHSFEQIVKDMDKAMMDLAEALGDIACDLQDK